MSRKLLITTPFGHRLGGAEQILWDLLRTLDRSRWEPYVIFHAGGPAVEEIAALGIGTEVVHAGERFRHVHRGGSAVVRMARIMRRERPDVVLHWLNRGQVFGGPSSVLARMSDRTAWVQCHLPDGNDVLDRFATRWPSIAVGALSTAAARAQAELVKPARPTWVLRPGIDLPQPSTPERLRDFRARWSLPEDRPLVGIVARLQPWKGQDRFLRALALLRDDGHDVHGVVVGGTQYGFAADYAEELSRLTTELGLDDDVTFTGHVDDPLPFYELIDVSVNASTEESFGLVLIEAMALGAPVVAADHGGPSEIIESGVSGILVPTPQPADLAAGIAAALAAGGRDASMTAAARVRVQQRFTVERMTRAFEDSLDQLARGEAPSIA